MIQLNPITMSSRNRNNPFRDYFTRKDETVMQTSMRRPEQNEPVVAYAHLIFVLPFPTTNSFRFMTREMEVLALVQCIGEIDKARSDLAMKPWGFDGYLGCMGRFLPRMPGYEPGLEWRYVSSIPSKYKTKGFATLGNLLDHVRERYQR